MSKHANTIAKLLAKAENTTEAEAQALREKAYSMMVKYAIDQLEIDRRRDQLDPEPEQIITETFSILGMYRNALLTFTHNVVTSFRTMNGYVSKNTYVHYFDDSVPHSTKGHVYHIVGYESDVQQVKLLLSSLQLQAISALNEWTRSDEIRWFLAGLSPMGKFKERRQFLTSFGNGVSQRIRSRFREAVRETTGTGTELALVDRRAAVDAWLEENMDLGKPRSIRSDRGSAIASASGYAAGQRANVGESAVGTRRSITN